ncbi:MAG: glycosyltransferase family 39 protein, partial [Phycisphaerae bacterium]
MIAVLAATVVGAALRFPHLASPELWVDESCTWYFVCQVSPFDFRTPYLLYENASRLYYMLLAGWTAVFGETPWGLRSFSAVLGTLTIPLVALWLRSVAGNAPAAIGAALAAVHALHVYYSREARFYPLWMIELIGLLWCGWLAVRTDRRRYWAGYAALALAALWTHYFMLFLAPV